MITKAQLDGWADDVAKVLLIFLLAGVVEVLANLVYTVMIVARFLYNGVDVPVGQAALFFLNIVDWPLLIENLFIGGWQTIVAILFSYAVAIGIVWAAATYK